MSIKSSSNKKDRQKDIHIYCTTVQNGIINLNVKVKEKTPIKR